MAHALPEAGKRRLLSFITGSDRVPIDGLRNLRPPFTISRNGAHSSRLPTAHTCFNHLLLPQYKVRHLRPLSVAPCVAVTLARVDRARLIMATEKVAWSALARGQTSLCTG